MRRRQGGAALVVVMMMVAVVSVLAVTINEQVRFSGQRLLNQRLNDQARWYALGGEQLVSLLLEDVDTEKVHLGQSWATREAVFPIEGGLLAGQIDDGQACFNVNNLYRKTGAENAAEAGENIAEKQFSALLGFVGIEPDVAGQLRDRLRDWLDEDQIPSGVHGAEDLNYSSLEPAYQTANRLMTSASEVALLAQLEVEARQKLLPLLCALPASQTVVNINTLGEEQAPVLAALLTPELDAGSAAQILRRRPEKGWNSVQEMLDDPLLADKEFSSEVKESLGVTSRFFRATIDVEYHQSQMRLHAWAQLVDKRAVVYAREYGELF